MTPFRTQALVIKNVIQEERKDLAKEIKKFSVIGSFEDFVSRSFSTIAVSYCRSNPAARDDDGML